MGAPTNYFVSPSSGSDSTGTGTIGNPWQTIQHALNNITRDSTNGDKINVQSGSHDILSAELDTTSYGTPTAAAPLVFEGYNSVEADGGVGVIDGDEIVPTTFSSTIPYLIFINMRITSFASTAPDNQIIGVGISSTFINCEIDNGTINGIGGTNWLRAINCYFHNIAGDAINFQHGSIYNCYFRNGCKKFTTAIKSTTDLKACIWGNIISLDEGSNGMDLETRDCYISHNSFYTTGNGSALAIHDGSTVTSDAGWDNFDITNNLFEGWTTGIAIQDDPDGSLLFIAGNAAYNCGTAYSLADIILTDDNETLGASPFLKDGLDHYANRAAYFFPEDVGNVLSPYGDIAYAKGAVQEYTAGTGSGPTPCFPVFEEQLKKKWRRLPVSFLREDTAATIKFGPFIDNVDGDTEETALTINAADVFLSKNGGAFSAKNESSACTHDRDGYYDCDLDSTDTNTAGILVVQCHKEGSALMVERTYQVMPSGIYDAIMGPPADLFPRMADTVLSRNVSNVEDTLEEHTLGTIVLAALEWQLSSGGSGLTIYQTNGVTEHITKVGTAADGASLIQSLT